MFYKLNSLGEAVCERSVTLRETGLSVALGCFDGVHVGHQALIERAVAKKECTAAVWTFSEPLSVPFIDNVSDRIAAFGRYGIRLAVCEDFDTVRTQSPTEFAEHLAVDLNVKHVVCGADFRYGKGRSGSAETLKRDMEKHGVSVEVISPIMAYKLVDGVSESEKISSTLIRRFLSEGEIEKANSLLGRPFSVTGNVTHGRQIGRTMDVPTVNQRMEKGRVVLKYGVYDTVTVIDGISYPSVTNFGMRPTVNDRETDVTCETHVIGESLDLYGKSVTVKFYRFAREERKFDSLESLKAEIESDIKRAKDFFDTISK